MQDQTKPTLDEQIADAANMRDDYLGRSPLNVEEADRYFDHAAKWATIHLSLSEQREEERERALDEPTGESPDTLIIDEPEDPGLPPEQVEEIRERFEAGDMVFAVGNPSNHQPAEAIDIALVGEPTPRQRAVIDVLRHSGGRVALDTVDKILAAVAKADRDDLAARGDLVGLTMEDGEALASFGDRIREAQGLGRPASEVMREISEQFGVRAASGAKAATQAKAATEAGKRVALANQEIQRQAKALLANARKGDLWDVTYDLGTREPQRVATVRGYRVAHVTDDGVVLAAGLESNHGPALTWDMIVAVEQVAYGDSDHGANSAVIDAPTLDTYRLREGERFVECGDPEFLAIATDDGLSAMHRTIEGAQSVIDRMRAWRPKTKPEGDGLSDDFKERLKAAAECHAEALARLAPNDGAGDTVAVEDLDALFQAVGARRPVMLGTTPGGKLRVVEVGTPAERSPEHNGRDGGLPYFGRYLGAGKVGCGNPDCGKAYVPDVDPGDGGTSQCTHCSRWTEASS